MPKLRPLPEKAPEEYRPNSQVEPRQQPPHGFQRGRSKTGGRVKGQQNVVTRSIREGIIEGLNRAGGPEGVAAYVTKIALEDPKLAVQMMALVVPRAVDAVVRNEVQLLTVQQLDESLRAAGLPVTKEVFQLRWSSDADTDVTEAEVAAEDNGNN